MTEQEKKYFPNKKILEKDFFDFRAGIFARHKESLPSGLTIKDPIKNTRTYYVSLPICVNGKADYVTYGCKTDIKKSYLCRHANMNIINNHLYQSRTWNKQSCRIIVSLTSLQGFFKDALHNSQLVDRFKEYEPLNHESLTYMFDPYVLKAFPAMLFLQVNNTHNQRTAGIYMEESVNTTTTHTIIAGYVKDFQIVLSHNPQLIFTIQDCLQHVTENYHRDNHGAYHKLRTTCRFSL